ncbi:hypothetical protein BAS06_03350 [Elizabethkingia miricola]|uniref:Bacteriocin n=1 Tax=Elizabethkingia miricola TaxID=172045 RepID=A0ABD5B836_ELIMR|nr:hypothetical protein [Elizabethkingia miricola]MDQ8749517.1 hypothetical protein [Elizabethkingia miricola]OPB92260.1 hypothetical protein BAS06_03350 [Elizabethkingia miricola]
MKNLKKFKRNELKSIIGGVSDPTQPIDTIDDGNGRTLLKCCTAEKCSTCAWGSWLDSWCVNGSLMPC